MLLYLINNTVDMLRRGQVAPYASAVVEALRPAVDEISFFSKFSDVARAQCLGLVRVYLRV